CGLTCSHREDTTWSGGNIVWAPYFACVAKLISLVRLRPGRGRRTHVRHVIGLTGLNDEDRHR
ncbi:hypothetical protein Taro_046961, partial [Colocasia esculenta]|nr:hypothetical protein [Colocasia esculenta]